MLGMVEKTVYAMAGVRLVSSLIELSGALLMLYWGTVSKALQVNAVLALVGPVILVTVTFLGITGLTDGPNIRRIFFIVIGVACILYGAKG